MLADAEVRELFAIMLAGTFDKMVTKGELETVERYPGGAAATIHHGYAYESPADGRPVYGLTYVRMSESEDDIRAVAAKLEAGIFDL